jgi:hypothetical protein
MLCLYHILISLADLNSVTISLFSTWKLLLYFQYILPSIMILAPDMIESLFCMLIWPYHKLTGTLNAVH